MSMKHRYAVHGRFSGPATEDSAYGRPVKRDEERVAKPKTLRTRHLYMIASSMGADLGRQHQTHLGLRV